MLTVTTLSARYLRECSNDAAALLPTLWWPAICEAVVRETLMVALPDTVDGLTAYTATIAKAAAALEERLMEAGTRTGPVTTAPKTVQGPDVVACTA